MSGAGQAEPLSNDPGGVYYNTGQLPYTYGKPSLVGAIRSRNEDFVVTELLGFVPSGSGEHLWHWVEKRGLTSLQVRDELAALYNCAARDIGMAGLKDKYACARQWFSVPALQAHSIASAGAMVERQQGGWCVLDLQRHQKKLQRGAHRGNHFKLRVAGALNGVVSEQASEQAWPEFLQRIERVKQQGFANYFGDQRFGYQGKNIVKAERALRSRQRLSRDKKSLYISALRSFLYNELLSLRVADANWCSYCDGDSLMLDGSNSFFTPGPGMPVDELRDITQRLGSGDIHVGGLLFGGQFNACDDRVAARYEAQIAKKHSALLDCLAMVAVEPGRRPMRALATGLQAHAEGRDIALEFALPAGSYATVLLRELLHAKDTAQANLA